MFCHKSEITFQQSQSKSENPLKCRGCLKQELSMNYLFVKFVKNRTLAEILEEFVGYKITEQEQFSEYLCEECTNVINSFVKFKDRFWEATENFKNLNNDLSTTHNSSDHPPKDVNLDEGHYECKDHLAIKKDKIEVSCRRKSCKIQDINKPNNKLDISFENYVCLNKETKCLSDELKQPKNVKCELCGESFKAKTQLLKHQRISHKQHCQGDPKRKKLLTQKTLGKSNISNNICSKYVSANVNCKQYCKICKQEFLIEEFEFHLDTHKNHVCDTCGHKFIRKTDLNDHRETHLDICKYVCQHCGKAFKVRTALNKHKRIHTNPREEICDVCGQRFNTRDTLKTHYKLKHIKSKDFQCNLCGLAFTLKSTLEKHIERHNPNRKRIYSCNLCNVSYINKYNLSRHHTIKHTAFENKPTCEFCGKGYVKRTDLMKHIKRHHGGNDTQEDKTKEIIQIATESDKLNLDNPTISA